MLAQGERLCTADCSARHSSVQGSSLGCLKSVSAGCFGCLPAPAMASASQCCCKCKIRTVYGKVSQALQPSF